MIEELMDDIGGNSSPGAADIKKVLGAGGIDVDEERLTKLLSELQGKSIDQLISEGSAKLASVPSGGAVAASGGAAVAAPSGGGGGAPKEEEKKKEEEKEESDDDMGFGLFD